MGIYSWYDLSREEQRTVLRLARQGSRHPDARIARVAEEWALEQLGEASSLWGAAFGAMLGDGASVSEGIRNHRRAKRIVRVSSRPATGSPR